MRGLFLLLLLANIGVLFWGRWEMPPRARPQPEVARAALVPLAQARNLVPRAPVAAATATATAALPTPMPGSARAPAPALVGPPAPATPAVPAPPGCVLADIPSATQRHVRAQLQALGVPWHATQGPAVYEVVSPAVATAGYAVLVRQARALHLPYAPAPGGRRLSYGVFQRRVNAERELARLGQVHVSAEIKPSLPAGPWVLGPLSPALAGTLGQQLHLVLKPHPCRP